MVPLKSAFWGLVGLFCSLVGLTSCSEDGELTYPDLLNEFADVSTNADGRFDYLYTDGGKKLEIVNSAEIEVEGVTPDTVYRILSGYVPVDGGGVKLFSLQAIPLLYPEPQATSLDGVKTDPVKMQSIWRGGNYLNIILQVVAQDGKHKFHVVEDSLVSSSSGKHTLYLRLSHDAGGDVQAYTQKAYFSIPLLHYASALSHGGSVVLDIPTSTGWERWEREY